MSVYTWSTPSMGGRLTIAISAAAASSDDALADAVICGRRVNAWANRLTRFSEESDLSRLNAADTSRMTVKPTLGAILGWARTASDRTGGIVDSTLLDARLAAETGQPSRTSDTAWQIERHGRTHVVDREPGTRFDLDGLAKGWLADRAADLLSSWPGVAVDADGDIALRADVDVEWLIDIADPRPSNATAGPLATLKVSGGSGWTRCYGVATSGTSVHRWRVADGGETHHLIDPRTRRSADTDIVQATVVAPTAREAEVIAKTAVILGSRDALAFLSKSAAHTALLLLESGDLACLPGVDRWLA
jgi:thiamine biosynthesis lipoprotein